MNWRIKTMATNLDNLKAQVAALFEKATDKELVSALTQINDTITGVEKDYTDQINENKELLNDYKEVIKSVGFKREVEPQRGSTEAPKLEDFLLAAKTNASQNK